MDKELKASEKTGWSNKELGLNPNKTLSTELASVYNSGLKDSRKAHHSHKVPL